MSLKPCDLTDDDLIAKVAALASAARGATASLIEHLAELERRDIHLQSGFKSLFGYCRRVLLCSEAGSYDRMRAAHSARRFPVVIPLLAEGRLHLTALRLLSPHLQDEDHLALLGGALDKSTRDVRLLLARWFPLPDVAASVRRVTPSAATPSGGGPRPMPPVPTLGRDAFSTSPSSASGEGPIEVPTPRPPAPRVPAPPRDPVAPLSLDRYEVRFTARQRTVDRLRKAQELLSHAVPDGDIDAIVDRGLGLVIAEAERERFAATSKALAPRALASASRTIPAAVLREVAARDGAQCAFVGTLGRCEERWFLEFHHVTPWAAGGVPTAANIALRCHGHNQYEAKVYFGPIAEARASETGEVTSHV